MAKVSAMHSRDSLEVWLDMAELGSPRPVGTLHHERGQFSFAYHPDWLGSPQRFWLDPELALYPGEFHAATPAGNFRIFLDSAPDRWGRLLMERRELVEAQEEGRSPRILREWDFLLGVEDVTRMGALRFRHAGGDDAERPFLDHRMRAAPPVTSLAELQAVSQAVESGLELDSSEHFEQMKRWLSMLVAPGSSLGGARPKANFVQPDGSLWIAKFPSREDRRDMGAWEILLHEMAHDAGIDVPPATLLSLAGAPHGYRSFCVQRFDRVMTPEGTRRRFFVSAMTLLRADDGDRDQSYLDLAEFIADHGAAGQVAADLAQLFRRLVFNILTSNRDDHLRNHGFIREATGWRIAPAYDLNPAPEKHDHALAPIPGDPRPSLATALESADFYRLSMAEATAIVKEVGVVVATWQQRAKLLGISRAEALALSSAFAA